MISPLLITSEFTPFDIGPPSVWLEADRGVGLDGDSKAYQVLDESGNGATVSQATPACRVPWIANGLNGRPVLRFSGTEWLSGTLPSILSGVAAYTATLVIQFAAPDALVIGAENSWLKIQRYTGNLYGYCGTGGRNVAVDLLMPHIINIVFDGAGATDDDRLQFYVDGLHQVTTLFTTPVPTVAPTAAGIDIGRLYGGGAPFSGDAAALIIHPGVVSEANRTRLDRAYGAKYEITVA